MRLGLLYTRKLYNELYNELETRGLAFNSNVILHVSTRHFCFVGMPHGPRLHVRSQMCLVIISLRRGWKAKFPVNHNNMQILQQPQQCTSVIEFNSSQEYDHFEVTLFQAGWRKNFVTRNSFQKIQIFALIFHDSHTFLDVVLFLKKDLTSLGNLVKSCLDLKKTCFSEIMYTQASLPIDLSGIGIPLIVTLLKNSML